MPAELVLVERVTDQHKMLLLVQWSGVGLPAEHGSDSMYTVAWKTARLGENIPSARAFKESYQTVTRPLAAKARELQSLRTYIVVHLRGPDNNTYWPTNHRMKTLGMSWICIAREKFCESFSNGNFLS